MISAVGISSAQASSFDPIDAIGIEGGLLLGFGAMGIVHHDIPYRSVDAVTLLAFPNFDLQKVIPLLPLPLRAGFMMEYRFINQIESSSNLPGDSNFKGNTFLLGLGAETSIGKFTAGLSLDFIGSHSFGNQDVNTQMTGYSAPLGFRIFGGYNFYDRVNAFAEFGFESFNHFNINGVGTPANLDNMDEVTFQVGATYHFDLGQVRHRSSSI